MIIVDGIPQETIPATDRGFAYGDGVFRTLALRDGKPRFWARHYAKLSSDCAALGFSCPSRDVFERDIALIASGSAEAAIKIVVTRGSGQRGYRHPEVCRPLRVVFSSPMPTYPGINVQTGVNARICSTRLGDQPLLAGVKHLNRLEQVLARGEWTDPALAEGLMLDGGGNVICGTMSNLFIVEGQALSTPALDRCGVAGVTRAVLIEEAGRRGIACNVEAVPLLRVMDADALVLSNSIFGVWSVKSLEGHEYVGSALATSMSAWLAEVPE